MTRFRLVPWSVLACLAPVAPTWAAVETTAALVQAVNQGEANATVEIAAGTFELTAPLRPKPGMTIKGAGAGKTILRNAAAFAPGNAGLESDGGATRSAINCDAYLINLGENTRDVTIADLTLTGPQVHGGICGVTPHGLELYGLMFKTFLWAGVRTYIMEDAHIHDNVFEDAGNKSMVTTGSSGGGLFLTYTKKTEIDNNRFRRSPGNDSYGVKGREAREVRIHHNTIETDFAIEFPFENDYLVEIDHNYLGGTVSIPKHSGGTFPEGGYTFHAHHNYFKTSYAFEFQRNAVEIDHNLFDFPTSGDYGNLISSFDVVAAMGGTRMHDNLIRNPGRGIYWNEGVYNDFSFTNNHVIGNTTATPRTEGLFDFRPEREGAKTNWSTIVIRDNIIELRGTARPLMRNAASRAAVIENNQLTNVTDAEGYANPQTGKPRGPKAPLSFRLGADEEWTINDWTIARSSSAPGGMGGAGGTPMSMGGMGGGQMTDQAGGQMTGQAGGQMAGPMGGNASGGDAAPSGGRVAETGGAGPVGGMLQGGAGPETRANAGGCSMTAATRRRGGGSFLLLAAVAALSRRRGGCRDAPARST